MKFELQTMDANVKRFYLAFDFYIRKISLNHFDFCFEIGENYHMTFVFFIFLSFFEFLRHILHFNRFFLILYLLIALQIQCLGLIFCHQRFSFWPFATITYLQRSFFNKNDITNFVLNVSFTTKYTYGC